VETYGTYTETLVICHPSTKYTLGHTIRILIVCIFTGTTPSPPPYILFVINTHTHIRRRRLMFGRFVCVCTTRSWTRRSSPPPPSDDNNNNNMIVFNLLFIALFIPPAAVALSIRKTQKTDILRYMYYYFPFSARRHRPSSTSLSGQS